MEIFKVQTFQFYHTLRLLVNQEFFYCAMVSVSMFAMTSLQLNIIQCQISECYSVQINSVVVERSKDTPANAFCFCWLFNNEIIRSNHSRSVL